ncbi:C6 transcription factor [Penicillium brasilianum]|uniref:C6 transcription factor n=1 Tax=Penicillium brasilianum TaxID=104259 RepID=A0A1S9RIH8_PENBI|nr:C6 transcription factor [Penicillium brasilianum]
MEERRPNKRKRTTLACDACRTRRTKCDSQRPSCHYCQTRGVRCIYQEPPTEPPDRVEEELSAINKRLDLLVSLMLPTQPISPSVHVGGSRSDFEVWQSQEDSPFDLPSKLLSNSSLMHVLGLDADFAQVLLREERTTAFEANANAGTRMLVVRHRHIASALAAFSARVHIWYPILPSGFSQEYFRVLSGPLPPSSETCLSLLVVAVGLVVEGEDAVPDIPYFQTAVALLPIIISECSVRSVQCLVLISLYYCCLLKPCQAHDYCLIASSKIQNIIKSGLEGDDPDTVDQTRRAYWSALLLENEIAGQLDVPKSGIWCLDEHVPLPLCQETWHFQPENTSLSVTAPASPDSVLSTLSKEGNTRSYFLAEIAMRRMLHRCNTAVQATSTGEYVYAPSIALELEHQLEEWYRCLPEMIRFEKGDVSQSLESIKIPPCPLSNFLRVQYYCCKLSIYWPAVYQAMQDAAVSGHLLNHCRRFFDSYVLLTPSIVAAFENCHVNRWTLFVSIFITSVAAMTAGNTPCLSELCSPQFRQSYQAPGRVDKTLLQQSPSLMMIQEVLEGRLSEASL